MSYYLHSWPISLRSYFLELATRVHKQVLLSSFRANQSTFFPIELATRVHKQVLLSSFRANQSTFLLFRASYTGTQVGSIIFIQSQSVYVLTVNSWLHGYTSRSYYLHSRSISLRSYCLELPTQVHKQVLLSSFRVNQSTFLLLIASYTGPQLGPTFFIQGQSVYVLTVNSLLHRYTSRSYYLHSWSISLHSYCLKLATRVHKQDLLFSFRANQSTFLLFRARYTGTQVDHIFFIQGQSVYVLTVQSQLHGYTSRSYYLHSRPISLRSYCLELDTQEHKQVLLSSFNVNQSTFLLLIASYTGTQLGPTFFIQGQSVYVLTANSQLHGNTSRSYYLHSEPISLHSFSLQLATQVYKQIQLSSFRVNKSTFLLLIASYTGTQVGHIINIQSQSVYILTVYSQLHGYTRRSYYFHSGPISLHSYFFQLATQVNKQVLLSSFTANQSTFLLFRASQTGTQVDPIIFIHGQSVYVLTVQSQLHRYTSRFYYLHSGSISLRSYC